jgi:predicted ATPase
MSSSVSIPRIVGREHELAALSAALDGACSGRAQVTLLTGEPGIGKTSTLSPTSPLPAKLF